MAYKTWDWTGANSWSGGSLEIYADSNGSAANSSTVTVKLWGRRIDGGRSYNYNVSNFWITLNGSTSYRTSGCEVSGSGWTLLHSYTLTIPHNADGTKSITVSGGGSITGTSLNLGSSGNSLVLDKIPRYAVIKSYRTTSVTQTSAVLSWTSDAVCDAVQYAVGNGSFITASGSTFTVSQLSPATSYSIKIRIRRKDSQLWTTSSALSIKTEPIAGISGGNGFTFYIGENIPLTFEHPDKNASYLKFGVQTGDGLWSPHLLTADIPLDTPAYLLQAKEIAGILYDYCPTANELSVRLIMGTIIDGKAYEQTYMGKALVTDSRPVLTDYSYCNTDTVTAAVLGTPSCLPQNLGNMQVQISLSNKACAVNGASMSEYVCSVSDSAGTAKLQKTAACSSDEEVTIDLGSLPSAGKYTISVYALDSRGNASDIIQKSFTVLPYHRPVTTIHAERINSYEQEIILDLVSVYSRLSIGSTQKNNVFKVKYRYVQSGHSDWSDYTEVTGYQSGLSPNDRDDRIVTVRYTDSAPLLSLPSEHAYYLEFVITDRISSVSEKVLISEGIPLMLEACNGQISIGMVPSWENSALLQVGGDILFTDTEGTQKNLLTELGTIRSNLTLLSQQLNSVSTNYETLSTDYIIESGARYQKWYSGKLEVWGSDSFTATTNTEQIRTVNFPFSFASTTFLIFLTLQRNGNVATTIREGDAAGNLKRTVKSTMVHCRKVSSTYTIDFNYYVIGTWK